MASEFDPKAEAEGFCESWGLETEQRNDLESLLTRAMEAGRDRGGWQPIETAPRDGTWILAATPSADPYYIKECAGYVSPPESIRWAKYHPNSPGKAEWRNMEGHRRPNHTVWQPLPEPPQGSRHACLPCDICGRCHTCSVEAPSR